MLAHDLVDRPTQDVDLFTPDPAEVTRLTDALAVALRAEGAQVRVDRRGPGFTRLAVTVADGRSVVVEIAHDARIREAVQLSFGRVLHPDEVRRATRLLRVVRRHAARASCRRRTPVSTAEFRRRVVRRRSSLGRRLCRLGLGRRLSPLGERGSMANPAAGCRGHAAADAVQLGRRRCRSEACSPGLRV